MFDFYLIISFFTFLIGTIFYKKELKYNLFLFYLLISFLVELLGGLFYKIDSYNLGNYFIFNIYTYLEYSIHFIILYQLFNYKQNKKMSLIFLVLFWIFILIINFFQIESFFIDQKYIYTFATVLFLILSLRYFHELLKSEKIYEFDKSIYFWYLLGIILFNVAYLPLSYFLNTFIELEHDLYQILLQILNILKNGFLIFGILWGQKK